MAKEQGIVYVKQLGGAQDLMFGFNEITQIRNGELVVVSEINSGTIPYNASNSVKDIIDKILAKYPI